MVNKVRATEHACPGVLATSNNALQSFSAHNKNQHCVGPITFKFIIRTSKDNENKEHKLCPYNRQCKGFPLMSLRREVCLNVLHGWNDGFVEPLGQVRQSLQCQSKTAQPLCAECPSAGKLQGTFPSRSNRRHSNFLCLCP